jgi:hypothetical protein
VTVAQSLREPRERVDQAWPFPLATRVVTGPLAREIDAIVSHLRPEPFAAFRIERVARSLRLELRRRRLGDRLHGVTLDERRVLLNRRLTGSDAVFTFAHEVAHILARRGHFHTLPRAQEEWFADRFAHELVLPRSWLTGASSAQLRRLSHARWLPAETFAVQLAAIDRAPRLFRSGSAVYCRHCGHRHTLPGCDCRSHRQRHSAAETIPELQAVIRRALEPFVQSSLPLFVHRIAAVDDTSRP